MNRLAGLERRFRYRRAINESAVCRTQVFEDDSAVIDRDLAMGTGNRRIRHFEIIGKSPPDRIGAILELNLPSTWGTGVNN